MDTRPNRIFSRWKALATGAAAAMLSITAAHAASFSLGDRYVSDEVIVTYHSAADGVRAKSAQASLGLKVRHVLDAGRVQVLQLPSVTAVGDIQALMRTDPAVAYVEPNFIRRRHAVAPNDALFPTLWGLLSTGQANFATDDPALASIPGADMDILPAWDPAGDGSFTRVGDGSVVVAVIDDAFDTDHPDLAANFIAGADLTRCTSTLSGCPSDVKPENSAMEHGTLVAGSLGAVGNNGIGVAGVIWNVQMLPLKVAQIKDSEVILDTGSILRAYEYARLNGARIVNASYGGPSYSQAEFDAINRLAQAGVLFVTSAGNFNSNLDYSVAAYPANYKLPNIVAVAATNRQDNVASFSQYGPMSTDVAAPGLQIVTTRPGGGYVTGERCGNGGTCGVNGTSFASPYVAGLAALMLSEQPQMDFREIKARLIEGAEEGSNGGDAHELTVGGRVNASNSLALPPRPSLVLRSVQLVGGDGNARLDPGERLSVEIVVENLWQAASNISAQLIAPDAAVRVLSQARSIASLAQGESSTLRFDIEVLPVDAPYQDLGFWVAFTADSGYAARRPFRQEIAPLQPGTPARAILSQGLHDEFHTYHLDVASVPANRRLIVCTRAETDVDILVKYATPAQYDIDLGAPQEDDPTFFTDADVVGGDEDGNEVVEIGSPKTGTYYFTVVNYDLTDSLDYTIEALLEPIDINPAGSSSASCAPKTASSGGGGMLATATLMLFGLVGFLAQTRRKMRA